MDMTPSSLDNLILITGGAKSGKSALAESLAKKSSNVYYLATMPKIEGDDELIIKIKEHQKFRPSNWITIEKECEIDEEIEKLDNESSILILDCLSTYVSNIMFRQSKDCSLDKLSEKMHSSLTKLTKVLLSKDKIQFIVVTNEVGWSIVPENKSARLYRDLLGKANQYMAKSAREVYLCVSGITMKIKSVDKETSA